jgi:hypothetical protein
MPDSVGSKDILFENAPFIGTVEFTDGIIISAPAFLFIFVGDLLLPSFLESYTLLISILIGILGSSLLLIKPQYMTLAQWFSQIYDFQKREKELRKNLTGEDGRPFESYEAVPDNDTRRLTRVSRVYPERGAIELEDNSMISIVEFTGSNLDMASNDVTVSTVDEYARSVSSQIENDIQFYLPMRPISTNSTQDVYNERMQEENFGSSDKRDNFMQSYLQDRVNWLEGVGGSSFIREQYVVVRVDNRDIRDRQVGMSSSGLRELPGGDMMADIKQGFSGEARLQSDQERRRKKLRELENRVENIGETLSVGPGNTYNKVSSKKAVSLIKEFWEGEKITQDEMQAMKSEHPVMIQNGDKK